MTKFARMNTRAALLFIGIAAQLVALAIPAVAYAEESGAPHHGSVLDLAANWVNFLLYVGLLYFCLRKVIPSAWAARRNKIRETVLASKAELEDAERELDTVQALTRNLAQEQARAKQEILEQAELEAAAIKGSAAERAERIKVQAKELLVGESRSAEAQVRQSLVARALELARAQFASGEFSARQQSYVDAAIDRAKRLVQ
mgnify:CR=1 FL=1